jgi:hypothetical protein
MAKRIQDPLALEEDPLLGVLRSLRIQAEALPSPKDPFEGFSDSDLHDELMRREEAKREKYAKELKAPHMGPLRDWYLKWSSQSRYSFRSFMHALSGLGSQPGMWKCPGPWTPEEVREALVYLGSDEGEAEGYWDLDEELNPSE